jgi:hypothetical protein
MAADIGSLAAGMNGRMVRLGMDARDHEINGEPFAIFF